MSWSVMPLHALKMWCSHVWRFITLWSLMPLSLLECVMHKIDFSCLKVWWSHFTPDLWMSLLDIFCFFLTQRFEANFFRKKEDAFLSANITSQLRPTLLFRKKIPQKKQFSWNKTFRTNSLFQISKDRWRLVLLVVPRSPSYKKK